MEKPLEIVFHNMPHSAHLESEIRERIDKLERLYDRITGCRVSVELAHRQHRKGNLYEVHIEMHLPGTELVISHEPHHARERFADPDVNVSLREAFRTAERRLVEFKRIRGGEVKSHAEPVAGQVAQMNPNEDYGFIMTQEGTQLYFHRNSVTQGEFDKMARGARVHFVEANSDTGPIATKVRVAADAI